MRAAVLVVAIVGAGAISARAADEDGGWTMAARDYANTRFSPLSDIRTDTVGRLTVAWKYDLESEGKRGQEAAPLVVGDTLYVVSAYPNVLYAFDLTKPGPALRWTYRPETSKASMGVACCDTVNRGAAYWDGAVIYNTLDGQTIAVDATSGRARWVTRLGDLSRGETMTMAPLVVPAGGGTVLVGNSGGELGVRGWLAGLDAKTGRLRWRAYSTGPDADCLIGPSFHPFYEGDRGTDLGVTSWPPDKWRVGGGTAWGFVSYDPALDLLYYGTANPGPWNPTMRPGDNKWTAGLFARRPSTGEAVWFYQLSPHDLYDHDGVNESVLVDLPIDGRQRQVLLHPDRNGYLYVLDRATGEVLSADPYHDITVYQGVDKKSGRLEPVPGKATTTGKVIRGICPASPGAKDWQPSAWSPRTRLLYIPHNNLCQDEEGTEVSYIAGTPYVGANVRMYFGKGGHGGFFTAWDPVARTPRWRIPEKYPAWSGALVTGGDVVFYGTMEGWFKAVDAKTGALLFRHRLDSGVIGQPTTFRGPDGAQYVAVLSGVGGWAGAVVSVGLDTRDASAALGFANAMRGLRDDTRPGGALWVFKLGGAR
jgi:PQQ-dependent dehydrogenase (methanol/ethanol family)